MLLSVIIPVYNVEKYIKECFDSILTQSFDDVEFICIDDGSKDSSGLICDEYAMKDKRFIVQHTANKGVAAARNLGLCLAKGEYIAWIDPDDYISLDWINEITRGIRENDWDILVFDYTILKNNNSIVKQYRNRTGFINKFQFLSDIVDDQIIQSHLWQKVFKRELFKDIIFPETVKCMEDYAVLDKIIEKAEKIYYIHKPLYYYRVRNDSLVMEIDLKKSYDCYLIAKERYDYLFNKGIVISKVGICAQALGFYDVCGRRKILTVHEKILKKQCVDEIRNSLWNLLTKDNCNWLLKMKFILCVMGVFTPVKIIYQFIRRRKSQSCLRR